MATSPTRPSETRPTARRSARRRLVAAVGLTTAALLAAFAARALTLHGLPDLGDPFDLAEFASRRVADEDNAYSLYLPAHAELMKGKQPRARPLGKSGDGWETLTAAERAEFEPLRPALDLWRRGTEKPDAAFIQIADRRITDIYDPAVDVRWFEHLAFLEASRLEGQGDFAGAWGWYRATLRWSRHLARNAGDIERLWAVKAFLLASRRVKTWASHDAVGPSLLRFALDDLIAIDRLTPKPGDILKVEYLMLTRSAESHAATRDAFATNILNETSPGWRKVRAAFLPFEWIVRREPERSRRVFQRVAASWLAEVERPAADRPPPVGPHKLVFDTAGRDPALDAWYESTLLLRITWPGLAGTLGMGGVERERAEFATLVIALASEQYRRDRGSPPASPDLLVGPYLDALPDGYRAPVPSGK